jgi:DNA mismatch repair protein MutS
MPVPASHQVSQPSVLWPARSAMSLDDASEPSCFADLHLDQLVRVVVSGRENYDLQPFFYARLANPAHAAYRHAVFRDLARPEMRSVVDAFAGDMRDVQDLLAIADAVHHRLQKALLFLAAAMTYCQAVGDLAAGLSAAAPSSEGMRTFLRYLTRHLGSVGHRSLLEDTGRIEDALARIRYTLHISGNRLTVCPCDDEADYGEEVRGTFAKFAGHDGGTAEPRPQFPGLLELDHVEAGVLERVAALFPGPFADVTAFLDGRQAFADPAVSRFDREVQFYLGYLDYLQPIRVAGLAVCYPSLSAEPDQTTFRDAFDLVLAAKLATAGQPVICNDTGLGIDERLLVVTGPNQAGKTTYARSFGQVCYLASLGCPVPAAEAALHMADGIFTHFDRGEPGNAGSGKLHDDLIRLREILDAATSRSVIILNEILTSTALADALTLGAVLAERIAAAGCLCLWVTFLDEMARYSAKTVSVVALVSPDDPAVRTFRLERRPADGRAYAQAVARKHQLSYDQILARISP